MTVTPASTSTVWLTNAAPAAVRLVEKALGGFPFSIVANAAAEDSGPVDAVLDAGLLEAGADPDFSALAARPSALVTAARPIRGGLTLLCPTGRGAGEQHRRDQFGAALRALALATAPGLRVNAIGIDAAATGLGDAVSLVLAAPSMTGQALWLDGSNGRQIAAPLAAPALFASPQADPVPTQVTGVRRMFVRDLMLSSRIGVYRHERLAAQRVRVNLDLEVIEGEEQDRLTDVVCYDTITREVRRVVAAGHLSLVETLAERIAEVCLDDPRVLLARVRVEKLDVFPDALSAGVEIERRRGNVQRFPSSGAPS